MKMKSGEPLAWRNLCFESASMNAQLVRAIDLGCAGGSTIAECLMTAALVEDEDEVSWYEAWNATARRVEAIAEQALAENHLISARQTYLRASMYYRAAEFYMHAPAHLERALEAASRMKECFLKAIPYLPFKVEPVRVPLEETTLPCYFYCAPSSAKTRAPALIISSGIDDTAEEVHFKIATAAVMRGYNVLVLQGPGQGQALREQGLKFRPDWETVVSSTVDYVVGRPEVDWNRIAVFGNSFSGALLVRAAAFEFRPKAYVLNSGVYSLADWAMESLPIAMRDLLQRSPDEFNRRMTERMKHNFDLRTQITDYQYKLGVDSPAERYRVVRLYDFKQLIDRIRSHVLVIDSEDELFCGQATQLYDALTSPKTWMYFSRQDMASAHCQAGNRELSNQRIFDWLDGFFEHSWSV